MKTSGFPLLLLAVLSCLEFGCAGITQPSRQNALDYTALDAVIEGGSLAKVRELIAEDPRLVNGKGWGDTEPLHLAALNDFTDIAALLLEKGASVNAKSKGGATALHIAAQRNNKQLAGLLLAHKANINALDSKGRTPADRAIEWHHPEMAQYLRDRGGRSTKTNRYTTYPQKGYAIACLPTNTQMKSLLPRPFAAIEDQESIAEITPPERPMQCLRIPQTASAKNRAESYLMAG